MNGIQQERMNRRFRRISKWMAVDLIIVLLAYIGAYSMRAIYSPLDLAAHIHYILVATITTLVFVYLFGIYDRIWASLLNWSLIRDPYL